MKIVNLSDLHFGNKLVNSEHMYESLQAYAYKHIQKCDLVILHGDLFHCLLDLNHTASRMIIVFLNDLFAMSIAYGFKIRILRGTFSHDRNQLMIVDSLAKRFSGTDKIDLKIYDKVSVDEEHVGDEHISICYLPDDLPYKSEQEVLDVVRELLSNRKLDKVDMVVGHGYCKHVLPYGLSGPPVTYTFEGLSSICKHVAVFGHIHTPSIKKSNNITIIYIGSMERMAHGEEERKGFLTIDTSNWVSTFIENKNTLLFSTYKSTNTDTEIVTQDFIRWMNTIQLDKNKPNHIRVIHESRDIRKLLGRLIVDMFGEYTCVYTSKKLSDDNSTLTDTSLISSAPTLTIPTEDNIVILIKQHIDSSDNISNKLSEMTIEKIWNLNFDGDMYDTVNEAS